MKTCQSCGNQNADDMRFCLNCGSTLPDAPVIVNFGSNPGGQSSPGTNPYGQSMETRVGRPGFQMPPPQQQNFSMVTPPPARGGSSKKILIAVGGVVALLFLMLVAVGGIIGYNLLKDPKPLGVASPTPAASPTAAASPSPTASKSATPTATPKPTDSPKVANPSYSKVKVRFDRIWVDYNQFQDGEYGMLIHLKFQVSGLKDVDSFATVFFQKSDGTFLDKATGTYSSNDGRVAVMKPLKPGFEPTMFEDLQIFMPYDALNLSPGKYRLKMDVDLLDLDENFIQHVTFKEFEYEKD